MVSKTLIVFEYACVHCSTVYRVPHPELSRNTANSLGGMHILNHFCPQCNRLSRSPRIMEVTV